MSEWVCAICDADSDLVSWPAPCGKCGSRAVIRDETHVFTEEQVEELAEAWEEAKPESDEEE